MAVSPAEVAGELGRRGFSRLDIDGGVTVPGFLGAGLIDTIVLTRVSLLLGSGLCRSLFDELEREIRLVPVVTRSFDGGVVQSAYRVVLPEAEEGAVAGR